MKATIRTDNPELRAEFLSIIRDNYTISNAGTSRSGKLLIGVSEMEKKGDEYVFDVEYA